jgi:hypothetical protein
MSSPVRHFYNKRILNPKSKGDRDILFNRLMSDIDNSPNLTLWEKYHVVKLIFHKLSECVGGEKSE